MGLDRPHDPPPVGLRVSTDPYNVRDAGTAVHLGLHLLVDMQDPLGPSCWFLNQARGDGTQAGWQWGRRLQLELTEFYNTLVTKYIILNPSVKGTI